MKTNPLSAERVNNAKAAFTTRRADLTRAVTLLTGALTPVSGDLVLARVDELGHHKLIELPTSRKAHLFPGDEIIVCYGNRYAPDQFEAEVPFDLGPCHLVAAGGLAAQVLSQHARMQPPTTITPLGLLGDAKGQRLNLRAWALPVTAFNFKHNRPLVYAVIGNSMNSGKTTTAANLIRGLVASGLRVGAAKITGTGAGNDPGFFADAGANPVYDFTWAGMPSTYRATAAEVRQIFETLVCHLTATGAQAIVLEIADGIFQDETRELVSSRQFRHTVDGVLFAAADSLCAAYAIEWFRQRELPLLGISGLVTASPLAKREAEQVTQLPVFDLLTLQQPSIAEFLHQPCASYRSIAVAV